MLIVVVTHYLADMITNAYQDLGRTTTRDMPWGPEVPDWIPKMTKKFYAVCQLFATTALLCQGTQILDGAFSIIFPIQLSTFLMTLVRKSLLSGTQWHLFYGLSLAIIFWLPVAVLFRSLLGFEEPETIPALASALDLQTAASQSLPFILFHLSLAPVSAILRMGLGINKYLVICIITGCMLFLVQWANGRPWGALLAPHSGGGGSLDVLSQASSSVH